MLTISGTEEELYVLKQIIKHGRVDNFTEAVTTEYGQIATVLFLNREVKFQPSDTTPGSKI